MAQWAACRAEPQQLGQFPLPTSLHPSPTVSVSPQLYHANRIESANTKRLNLWLSFSRTVLCLFVCQSVLSWPHPQYLITFFLLFFLFPNQRAAIRHLISQKRRALQPFQNKSLEKNLSLCSAERWVYGYCPKQCWISPDVFLLEKSLVVTYCRISKSAGFFFGVNKSLS